MFQQRNLTNNNVQFQPDKALFFKQLCSDRNAFTFLFSGEKYQRTIINASCALSQWACLSVTNSLLGENFSCQGHAKFDGKNDVQTVREDGYR